MAKEMSQTDRREYAVFPDDFGRLWETTIDIVAKGPCAAINPKGWNDPLNTPQQYLVQALGKDQYGQRCLKLKEQLIVWRDFLKKKAHEYDQTLYNDAMMLFGAEGPKAYEERSPALLNYTGEGPQAWEPVEAAIQGNSAALGKKPLESDPRVAKYFVKKQATSLSFSDEDLMDLEEQHDPDALGGKKIPKTKKPVSAEV